MRDAEIGGELPVVTKQEVRDLIPDLAGKHGYVVDKVESFAIDAAGTGYIITDESNDPEWPLKELFDTDEI